MPVLVLSKQWLVVVAAAVLAIALYVAPQRGSMYVTVVTPPIPMPIAATPASTGGSVACTDAVAGIWVGRSHNPIYDDWHEITLEIRRAEDGVALLGTIRARIWAGDWSREVPPQCPAGGRDEKVVTMDASGTIDGETIQLDATRVVSAVARCSPLVNEYNLDSFTGAVDEVTGRLEAVNNDGGRASQRPWSFRRIACAAP